MNPTIILFDLPDSEVDRMDGFLYRKLRDAGYSVSPRSLINDWNCWRITVGEFLEML